MLFLRLRRRVRSSGEISRPYGRKTSFPFSVLFLLITILFIIYFLSQRIGALIVKMSEWMIADTIVVLVNDAIYDKVEEFNTEYDDIITLQTDSTGKITALSTNMAYVNRLQTQIVNKIYETIPDAAHEIIHVPLANILGSRVFSGSGPCIPIKVLSVTNVKPKFTNVFTSAGINQTRHQIFLDIDIELSVLVPGYKGITHIYSQVIIAETVIVGDVPHTYIDFN